jgi:hypothetical protein
MLAPRSISHFAESSAHLGLLDEEASGLGKLEKVKELVLADPQLVHSRGPDDNPSLRNRSMSALDNTTPV